MSLSNIAVSLASTQVYDAVSLFTTLMLRPCMRLFPPYFLFLLVFHLHAPCDAVCTAFSETSLTMLLKLLCLRWSNGSPLVGW